MFGNGLFKAAKRLSVVVEQHIYNDNNCINNDANIFASFYMAK